MSQWAVSLPTVAVWIVGLLFAFGRWRQSPKVSLLVMISCGLSLLATFLMPLVMYSAIALLRPATMSIPVVSLAISVVWHCLAAISGGLLLYTAFVDRPQGMP
ncbi:MAG: hypothetical protein WCB27_20125 [Thermoguttaceae bacterium]